RCPEHVPSPSRRLPKSAGKSNFSWSMPVLGPRETSCRHDVSCPAPQQLGTGRGCNRGNAVANQGRQNEADGTTEDCRYQTGACKQQGDLAHANGAVPDDEAARSQLADQPGKGSQREIDPDPGGIGM